MPNRLVSCEHCDKMLIPEQVLTILTYDAIYGADVEWNVCSCCALELKPALREPGCDQVNDPVPPDWTAGSGAASLQ